MQSRIRSLYESVINILIGLSLSMTSYAILFPLLGLPYRVSDSLLISVWFTVLSVVRQYVIRRWFAKRD